MKKYTVTTHILFWAIFIGYEMTFLIITSGISASLTRLIVYYFLNIGLFYFNAHVILDYAFFKTSRPYLISIALVFVEIVLYLLIKFGLDVIFKGYVFFFKEVNSKKTYLYENIYRGVYFIGLSIAYWSMLYMIRFKERNHFMETEQLKAHTRNLELQNSFISVENAYLQNQISPHLLFNSLNFIYTTVRGLSEYAGEGIIRLSDLMRYSLVGADDTRTVLLSDEILQLENLIKLCRMRFGDQFYLRFMKKGKLADIRILPLILITLVENMMKHGDLGDKNTPARILLEVKGSILLFETCNLKRNTNLYHKNGIGLKNIDKRLNNYYQDKYTLVINDTEDTFLINLTLPLYEY